MSCFNSYILYLSSYVLFYPLTQFLSLFGLKGIQFWTFGPKLTNYFNLINWLKLRCLKKSHWLELLSQSKVNVNTTLIQQSMIPENRYLWNTQVHKHLCIARGGLRPSNYAILGLEFLCNIRIRYSCNN